MSNKTAAQFIADMKNGIATRFEETPEQAARAKIHANRVAVVKAALEISDDSHASNIAWGADEEGVDDLVDQAVAGNPAKLIRWYKG